MPSGPRVEGTSYQSASESKNLGVVCLGASVKQSYSAHKGTFVNMPTGSSRSVKLSEFDEYKILK